MKVIITGGGSGGHVNPALAIANIIKTNEPDSEIIFVGTSKGLENDLVPKAGYELRHVEISGIRRSLSPSNIKTAVRIVTSQFKARKLIKEFGPDVVIGTGGYACWPCVKVAADMGIPTVLHEANASAGFAVKRLASKVDVILTNFEETAKKITNCKRAVAVGMPMRGEFERITKEEARKKLGIEGKYKYVILSFGGSLGAPMVNKAATEVMSGVVVNRDDVVHYHSSGSREFENMSADLKALNLEDKENVKVSPYIYDMSLKMAAADVVICRAGAMTLAELSRLGTPAVLIPSPNVTDNHQYKNAKILADADAAIIIEEKQFDGEIVKNTVEELLFDKERLNRMSINASRFYDLETSCRIYSEIKRSVSEKK